MPLNWSKNWSVNIQVRCELCRSRPPHTDSLVFVGKSKASEKKLRMVTDQKRRVANIDVLVDFHFQKLEHFRVAKLKVCIVVSGML